MPLEALAARFNFSRRPLKYSLALTTTYMVLSVIAFLLIDWSMDFIAQGHLARLFDRVEFETAAPFVVVSSLLFLSLSYGLLHRLLLRTQALERVDAERVVAEHRALLGVLASSVIHDSNNLLMTVQGNAFLLERYTDLLDATGREYLGNLEQGITRLSELMALFMRYAAVPNATAPLELGSVMSDSLALIRRHSRLRDCTLTLDAPQAVAMQGNPMLLWSALANLVLNAAEATGGRGRIEVRLQATPQQAVVEIHDDGPGIPPGAEALIFRPFYTTKPDGTGLGLTSVQRCAEAHGGTVEVTRSPLGGACFRLALPLRAKSG